MPVKKDNAVGCASGCIVDSSVHCSYDALLTLPQFADCGGKTSFSPIDIACGLCQLGGIPGFKAGKYVQGLGTLAATGLDMVSIRDPKSAENAIKKALAYKTWTTTVSHNNDGVVFFEEQLESPETTITADATSSANIVVADIAGFNVGMKVMILTDDSDSGKPCCDIQLRRNITAINVATKTITLSAPVTVLEGDDLIALWQPLPNCSIPGESGFSSRKEYFTSYYQNFGTSITFSAADANKCNCSFDQANQIVDYKLKKAFAGIADQMLKAKYLAQNFSSGSGNETMGSIPTMQYAETTYGSTNIHSLKGLKTPTGKVNEMYKIFSIAQRAGEEVSDLWVGMTQGAYDKLRMMSPAFHQVRGCMPVCQNNEAFEFEVMNLKNLGKNINFFHEPELDRIFPGRDIMHYNNDSSFHIVAPEYLSNVNMQSKSYEKMVDMFMFEEVNPSARQGKINCDVQYSLWTRLAYIWLGARFGAIGLIEL